MNIESYAVNSDEHKIAMGIAKEIEKIQRREQRSVVDIFSEVPSEILDERWRLFRFLSGWNNVGHVPLGMAV